MVVGEVIQVARSAEADEIGRSPPALGKIADTPDLAGMTWTNAAKPGMAVKVQGTFKQCSPGGVRILVGCKILTTGRP
jgi:hypothetical protein